MCDDAIPPQETDEIRSLLAAFARENLCAVYFGGLSSVIRLMGKTPSDTEVVLLDDASSLNLLIERTFKKDFRIISAPPNPQYFRCSLRGKAINIYTVSAWITDLATTLEGLCIDVRDGRVLDLSQGHADLNSRVVRCTRNIHRDPIFFWNALITYSHLEGFSFEFPKLQFESIYFTDPKSEDYRFKPPVPHIANPRISFGGRFITFVLTNLLKSPHFPFQELLPSYKHLLGTHILRNFDEERLHKGEVAFANIDQNLGAKQTPALRLACLLLPLYLHAGTSAVSTLIDNSTSSSQYIAYEKMIRDDAAICPYICHFCLVLHCFEPKVVITTLHILKGYDKLNLDEVGEWLYLDAGLLWEEAAGMHEPDVFDRVQNAVVGSPTLDLLMRPHLTLSRTQLSKIHFAGYTQEDNRAIRLHFYKYLLENPDTTLQEYAKYVSMQKSA